MAAAQGSSSKSNPILFDLLTAFQRAAQEQILGNLGQQYADIGNWQAGNFPGLTSNQQTSLAGLESQAMQNVDYFSGLREQAQRGTGTDSQQFQDYLSRTIDQPADQALERGINIAGAEGAGAGHIGRAYSSQQDQGMSNLQAQHAANIGGLRSQATQNQNQFMEGLRMQQGLAGAQGTQQAWGNWLDTVGQRGALERQAEMEKVAYGDQFRMQQLQAAMGALGQMAQLASSVGMGIGNKSKGQSWGFST